MKQFKDKLAVITGAGSGMGRAYALAFAREGAKISLCDIDREGLEETLALVSAAYPGTQAYIESVDMGDKAQVFAFAESSRQALGDAAVVINNAGIEGNVKPVWASETEDYERVFAVNVYGVIHGCQAFLPQLQRQPEAAIVNVSSLFGLIATPNHSDYCASKFAIRGFTEALMAELQDSHIQVHSLHPGGINTNITRKDGSQAFRQHYLRTPPEAIVDHVIRCIRRNQARIVYGRGALRAYLGSKLLSLGLMAKIIWWETRKVIDLQHYSKS